MEKGNIVWATSDSLALGRKLPSGNVLPIADNYPATIQVFSYRTGVDEWRAEVTRGGKQGGSNRDGFDNSEVIRNSHSMSAGKTQCYEIDGVARLD